MQPPNKQPEKQPGNQPSGPQFKIPRWVWPVLWIVLLGWTFFRLQDMVSLGGSDQPIAVPYSFFYDQVEAGNVSEVLFQDNQVQGTFKASVTYPPSGSPELAQGVTQQRSTSFTTTLLTDSVPDPQLVQVTSG